MITNNYFEVVAIKEHKPIHQSQLAFKKGQKFIVVETAPTGWWRGEFNGKSGLFPQSYVNRVESTVEVDSPELAAIHNASQSNGNPTTHNHHHQPPSSLLPPPPLTSIVSVTNINDIKIEEFINNLPPPPNTSVSNQQNSAPIITQAPIPPPMALSTPTPASTNENSSLSVPSSTTSSQPKSPRFNVPQIQQQIQEQLKQTFSAKPSTPPKSNTPGTSSPAIYNTISVRSNTHSRKNSGPSTSVDEAYDEVNYHSPSSASASSSGNYSPSVIANQADKFKTLPSNSGRSRTPILNHDRIGMKDINPDVPYYIVRAMEPHHKQAFDELEVAIGDLIVVYNDKSVAGEWWVGKIKSVFGVFPKKCVEIIKDISPNPSTLSPPLSFQQANTSAVVRPVAHNPPQVKPVQPEPTYRKGIAMASYNSQFGNYLSFKKGDEIILLSKEGEFWKGRIGNQIGLVSSNFINEVQLPTPGTVLSTPTNNHQPTATSSQQPFINNPPQLNQKQTASPPITTPPSATPIHNSTQSNITVASTNNTDNEEESIAIKIKESMSHFETREELLAAVQNLAIKFVKQTKALKKELADEKVKSSQLENEINLLENEILLLKKE